MGIIAGTASEGSYYVNFCCDNGRKYITLQEAQSQHWEIALWDDGTIIIVGMEIFGL